LSDIDFPKHIFALTHLVLASALADTLVMLSEFRGRKDMKWLDDFEAKIIKDLKNSHIEGMNGKDEIKIVTRALEILKFIMDDARAQIINATKDD
jgi:hypothetical protein